MSTADPFAKIIAKLAAEVDAELANPEIAKHKHGRPIGYHDGCRGPLCLMQHRERQRQPGQKSSNPFRDAYLKVRMEEYKESLKKGTQVA
ncbi:hypothetical protein PBI_WOES_1 [Gordonia phage Woes]|uniref:Uncharacterized protein n=5 Tax=Woesvirus woes TaxID=1982751 RepID=A0A482JHT0_9CAUD|nr:hypothetical protein BH793_gp01 [Gordonia phage Woes]QAX94287.1 hypothetical protein SEA_GUILLAUME_1 [Gordonia phage Guillaume]QBP31779.1 hypothetical protein SEA_NIMI13_1 [Gordonia phage Nimi13]QDF16863.1 hypothetical protein SEA_TEAL_1 [Gordonia phage Teal]QDH48648.1 hypothetical protein SEA_NEWT_1 [Gordonia phage Newt]UVF60776.1 hypothetical protein SEA_STICKER17_1 [Gordonia phage Sticker17]UVK60240.1 hypothetical protein SEA_SHELLEY_1 [Gordonia phage Shelley]UVK60731.1 hypothetical pr